MVHLSSFHILHTWSTTKRFFPSNYSSTMVFDELTKLFAVIKLDFMVECLNEKKNSHLLLLDLVTYNTNRFDAWRILQMREHLQSQKRCAKIS